MSPDGFLHHLAKVGLLLGKGNQLWLHLDPDCLHDLLDVLGDVEVESEHLAQHEGPLLQVKQNVVSHLGCKNTSFSL